MKPLLSLFLLLLTGTPNVFAARYYVKTTGTGNGSSWATAAGNLKTLLDAAQYGDEIWVAAGTYLPSIVGDRDSCFVLKNGVGVYGGFAGTETLLSQRDSTGVTNLTVLSGELQGDTAYSNNTYNVVCGTNIDSNTILDGFTITRGYATRYENSGGGILLKGGRMPKGGNPILKNLIITLNRAKLFGGGICIFNSSPTLQRVILNDNFAGLAGGGLYGEEYSSNFGTLYPVLENVSFNGNYSKNGGGAYFQNGGMSGKDLEFTNNTAENYAGGLSAPFEVSLSRLTFKGNKTIEPLYGRGGALTLYSYGTVDNVLIADNTATEGAGLWLWALDTLKLTNFTFGQNNATGSGNQVYMYSGAGTLFENCIFDSVANTKGTFGRLESVPLSPVLIKNSLLRGRLSALTTDGGGNLQLKTPGFVNAAAGNYQLLSSSWAVNAGNNAAVAEMPKDLLLRPRIYNSGRVDMGAYEYQGAATPNAIAATPFNRASVITVFPNPATRILHLKSTASGTFTLHNLVGVLQLHTVLPANSGATTVPLQNLPAGLYSWQFQTNEGRRESGKLLIEQ